MKKLSASQRRFLDNATLVAASQIIFKKLKEAGVTTHRLGDLISMSSGEPLTSSQMDDSLPFPVYGGGGLTGYYSRYLFETPKIAIGRVGARCGCVYITEPKAWITDNALYLTAISELLDEGYLIRALSHLDLRQQANQAAQPVVSQKKINPQVIPVPDIALQRQIYEFLDVVERRQKGDKRESLPDLPSPLSVVKRIVVQVEELAGKIEEARSLRHEVIKDLDKVLLSLYQKLIKDVEYLPMQLVAPLKRRPVEIELSKNYPELGIRSFGKGTFHKPALSGAEVGTKRIFRIEANDLLFQIVFAWEGAVAVAQDEDHGRFGSHRFLTCVPKPGLATSSFLCFHFLTEQGLEELGKASPGGAGRNRTLGLKALENIKVPVPRFEKQLWFDNVQAKVNEMKRLREEAIKELDAMLPSILNKAFKGEL